MKLVELKCKNCGAVLKVKPNTNDIHCDHCKTNYKLDDGVQHIKYDNMEKLATITKKANRKPARNTSSKRESKQISRELKRS